MLPVHSSWRYAFPQASELRIKASRVKAKIKHNRPKGRHKIKDSSKRPRPNRKPNQNTPRRAPTSLPTTRIGGREMTEMDNPDKISPRRQCSFSQKTRLRHLRSFLACLRFQRARFF